jgi:hypothetical protein
VQGDTTRCLGAAYAHMGLETILAERGLGLEFEGWKLPS